jgi:hypothetical protein
MIPKKCSKIFTISIFSLLATSAVIPIAHASEDKVTHTGPLKRISKTETSKASSSQPLDDPAYIVAAPLRRAVSAPEYRSADRKTLLTEEPIPAPSVMIRRPSLMQPPREKEVHAAQDRGEAEMDALSEALIPLSQPVAGFIPLSGHQCSQFDESNTDAALARLGSDTMKDHILPNVERLLEHTWHAKPIPTIAIKDELMAVVAELKAGKPQQAAVLSAALIEKVNAAETTGPLDEFSRLHLYSVQTVLHLLAGTPYIALNNFLELRQLGISWHSYSRIIPALFSSPGNFYGYLNDFVSSDKATTIWGEDERIRKLWQGHAQFDL